MPPNSLPTGGGSAVAGAPSGTAGTGEPGVGGTGGGGGTEVGGTGGVMEPSPGGGVSGQDTGGSGPTPVETPIPEGMIDDLEDNDHRIFSAMGRTGPWHIFNNEGNGGNQQPSGTFAPEVGGANGSMYAVHTTGEGYEFAGIGFDLNNAEMTPESAMSQPFDASAWQGIAFWAKGSASLRVEVPSRAFVPTDRGGACSDDCWNVYGHRLEITTEWQEYKVPFAMMEREMGGMEPPLNVAELMSVSFKHEGAAAFDFWVDEIRFYRD